MHTISLTRPFPLAALLLVLSTGCGDAPRGSTTGNGNGGSGGNDEEEGNGGESSSSSGGSGGRNGSDSGGSDSGGSDSGGSDSGGSDSGGGDSGGSGSGTSSDRCTSYCEDYSAPGCEHGPSSVAQCVTFCEGVLDSTCVEEYEAVTDCTAGKEWTCGDDGFPTVADCENERVAVAACIEDLSNASGASDCDAVYDYVADTAASLGCNDPNETNTLALCEDLLGEDNPCSAEENAFFACSAESEDNWECDEDDEITTKDDICGNEREARDACREENAEQCNDLEVTSSEVSEVAASGDLPEAMGGTIAEGIYHLTAWEVYPGGDLDSAKRRSITLDISGSEMQLAGESSGEPRRGSFEYDTDGNQLTLTPTCPEGGGVDEPFYTATETSFSLIRLDEMRVETFTKQ